MQVSIHTSSFILENFHSSTHLLIHIWFISFIHSIMIPHLHGIWINNLITWILEGLRYKRCEFGFSTTLSIFIHINVMVLTSHKLTNLQRIWHWEKIQPSPKIPRNIFNFKMGLGSSDASENNPYEQQHWLMYPSPTRLSFARKLSSHMLISRRVMWSGLQDGMLVC